ncbi:PAS domain-containing protein [Hymenobacter algoricola]|uniref:PAS fold-4 domain-containing protein n=1 Tax=Hymenobacter algoricola TaxID=486267 RepID=A0ABP7NTE7_9BACT
MPGTSAPLPADFSHLGDLVNDLLAVSLTGVIFYTPLYDPAGEVIDFSFAYLNPAAQRMMRMPERPPLTHLQQWPHSKQHGTFAFHVDAFVSGEPREYDVSYQAGGYDSHYRLAARRSGSFLLVSFTDPAGQPRPPVEEALHTAPAAEKTARADAEAEQVLARQLMQQANREPEVRGAEPTQAALAVQAEVLNTARRLAREREAFYQVFEQTPAVVALLRAPGHRYEYVNPAYQAFFPGRQLVGLDLAVAVPELQEQGFVALLDRVYQTGETFFGAELPFAPAGANGAPPRQGYFNFTYQAYREAGAVAGISIFAYDVTE